MGRKRGVLIAGAHALITGGARGIGLATAVRLVDADASVTLWDLDDNALDAARDHLERAGGAVHTAVVDITDGAALDPALEHATAALGPVDILINNAGHLAPGRFEDQDADVWMKTIEVNLAALVRLTRLVIPGMYARNAGHVVNISSAAGAIGVPGLAVYSATKWAVWGFSEALRAEARDCGVRVSSIHPSYIAEGMFAGARLTGPGRLIVPQLRSHDVVAEAIVEAALRRGRTAPKRPRSVELAVLLRGLLPDRWFNGLMRILGVWDSMGSWRGRSGPS
jgi:all-trans-retinol dehydrogenase (NAD+)